MERTVVIGMFTTFKSKRDRFIQCKRRTSQESEVNSSSGAKFSLSSRGKYKKPSVKYVLGWSHGQNCCNTYVYKVLVQTES